MKVNNLPENYKDYKYVVVRAVDGQNWFYGCWNDFSKAESVAYSFSNGHVINTERVERG